MISDLKYLKERNNKMDILIQELLKYIFTSGSEILKSGISLRAMFFSGKILYAISVGKSKIHGRGAYALSAIPARKKIGSMSGHVISKREARKKIKRHESIAMVELWNGKAIDASADSNDLRYINHSCNPNTFMRTFNYHVEFYALREIHPNEELTCNYGETHHNGKKTCKCGAPNCKGFI